MIADPDIALMQRHQRALISIIVLLLVVLAMHALALLVVAKHVVIFYLPARQESPVKRAQSLSAGVTHATTAHQPAGSRLMATGARPIPPGASNTAAVFPAHAAGGLKISEVQSEEPRAKSPISALSALNSQLSASSDA